MSCVYKVLLYCPKVAKKGVNVGLKNCNNGYINILAFILQLTTHTFTFTHSHTAYIGVKCPLLTRSIIHSHIHSLICLPEWFFPKDTPMVGDRTQLQVGTLSKLLPFTLFCLISQHLPSEVEISSNKSIIG